MLKITIPDHRQTLREPVEVDRFLARHGIEVEHWPMAFPLAGGASDEAVLDAYRAFLRPYQERRGLPAIDVVTIRPGSDDIPAARAKLLREHTHPASEVRLFAEGRGWFWFHTGEPAEVFCLHCEAGDLLVVPADTRHWLDIPADEPVSFVRLLKDPKGWVAHYCEGALARRYSPL